MINVIETGNLDVALEKNPFSEGGHFSSNIVRNVADMPVYDMATLVNPINVAYGKVWSFTRRVPRLTDAALGNPLLKVPSWCNAIMFLTVVDILASAGDSFHPFQYSTEELALYGYVPAGEGSTDFYPETKIAFRKMTQLGNDKNVYRDLGSGNWEVIYKPTIMPVCGFQYVLPAFHGIQCAEEDKPKTLSVIVWAVPINTQYHRPVSI